jgi:pilus assembly protein Flp/PilA
MPRAVPGFAEDRVNGPARSALFNFSWHVNRELRAGRYDNLRSLSKGEYPMQLLARFAKDESGATAIEYGLIAAGISVAIIAVVNGIGSTLNTKFDSINTQLR